MIAKRDRPERIRELRRQGLSVSDICEQVGVTRQTVWRHCRGLEPVPPAPTPDGNGHVDLETAQSVGLGVLVDKARTGSVSAAAHVFKIASAEIRANKCVNHVAAADVVAALHGQYGLWRMHLQGDFVRRILLEFDVDPARIESLVDDAIDAITKELNLRFEAGGGGGGGGGGVANMGKEKSATFAEMARASLGHGMVDGVVANSQGGTFRLPLERAAVIEADDVTPGRERVVDGVEWLRGDSDASPILSRLNIIPTSQTRGKIASGAVLPQTSMQGQSGTSALGRGIAFPTTPSPALGDLFTFTADASGITAIDEDGAALTAAETDETYRFNGTAWQRQAAVFGEHGFDLDSVVEAKSEISHR